MRRQMSRIGLACACVAAALAAGCNVDASKGRSASKGKKQPIAQVGQECVVHFRRDALGASSQYPIGPKTGTFNEEEVVLRGYFRRMDDEWLVIQFSGRKDGNEIYIPREMILLVEVIREPEPPATMPTG